MQTHRQQTQGNGDKLAAQQRAIQEWETKAKATDKETKKAQKELTDREEELTKENGKSQGLKCKLQEAEGQSKATKTAKEERTSKGREVDAEKKT